MSSQQEQDGFTLTTDRIIGLVVIVFLGFMAFQDNLSMNQTGNEISLAQLAANVEELQENVNELLRFAEVPRFTADDYNIRTDPIINKVVTIEENQNRRSQIIEDWATQTSRMSVILESHTEDLNLVKRRIQEIEEAVVNDD